MQGNRSPLVRSGRFLVCVVGIATLLAPESASASDNASLLGLRFDFSDGSLDGWRTKNNAKASIVEEQGNRALRFTSAFEPFTFAWVTRHFPPRTSEGMVRVRFRIRGDGSGHRLEVHLGTPSPQGDRSLYYINTRQTVTLDFTGWRTMSLDLGRFETPRNGLRDRDLAQVQFVEFMVHSQKEGLPLDIQLDDVEFAGYSSEELAAMEKRREDRRRLVEELRPSLAPIRQSLEALSKQLDRAAEQGKYVDEARLYRAALDWCVRDIERTLEAEELEIVEQARPLVAALRERVDVPRQVLDRVKDRAPEETDRFDYDNNPYFKIVITALRPHGQRERFWPRGAKGYREVTDAWTFRRFGDEAAMMVWAISQPKSPVRHHPMLLANALNLFDLIAHQHRDGDFNIDRTAAQGFDPNINRFCLAPALDAWWRLRQAYPELLPAAFQTRLEAGFKVLVEHQVAEYGLEKVAQKVHPGNPAYPNMDVHYLLIMELAHRTWSDARYAAERDGFLKILQGAIYPGGAFCYIHTQNECFVYHQLNVAYLARYWQLRNDPAVLDLLRKTIPYYPYNVEPAGMPEYYTDACWKHYWGRGDMAAPAIIAALFDDPLNRRVYEITSAVWGHERGHIATIAAEFFKPAPSKPLPDNYVFFDENIQGPRGRLGPWSFAANGRNYGVGAQGKDTFVGCMLTDAGRRPPLDAALQVVTAEVRLNHTGNHWTGGRCFSAQEKLTTALGPDFGSLAVRYTVSRPGWNMKEDDLLPWEGTQQWFLSKDRLVGLVSLEAVAYDRRAAIHGRIRLGMSREIESLSGSIWKYGRLIVKIHDHNYAKIVSKPSETTFQDKPDNYRSTEITLVDPLSLAAGERGEVNYAKGTRYWFLVEVLRDAPSVKLAEDVERIEGARLAGFRFREAGRNVAVLHNPTDEAIAVPAIDMKTTTGLLVYRDPSGKPVRLENPAGLTIGPREHAVLVSEP